LSPTKQQTPTRNALRRDQFQAIDRELRAMAWRDRRGAHDFDFRPRPVQDRELNSRFPGAPQTRTVQFEPTARGNGTD
jgi:hypothetical protein